MIPATTATASAGRRTPVRRTRASAVSGAATADGTEIGSSSIFNEPCAPRGPIHARTGGPTERNPGRVAWGAPSSGTYLACRAKLPRSHCGHGGGGAFLRVTEAPSAGRRLPERNPPGRSHRAFEFRRGWLGSISCPRCLGEGTQRS